MRAPESFTNFPPFPTYAIHAHVYTFICSRIYVRTNNTLLERQFTVRFDRDVTRVRLMSPFNDSSACSTVDGCYGWTKSTDVNRFKRRRLAIWSSSEIRASTNEPFPIEPASTRRRRSDRTGRDRIVHGQPNSFRFRFRLSKTRILYIVVRRLPPTNSGFSRYFRKNRKRFAYGLIHSRTSASVVRSVKTFTFSLYGRLYIYKK